MPFKVSIQDFQGFHTCGGTYVSFENKTFVMTAAHCLMDDNKRQYPRAWVSF